MYVVIIHCLYDTVSGQTVLLLLKMTWFGLIWKAKMFSKIRTTPAIMQTRRLIDSHKHLRTFFNFFPSWTHARLLCAVSHTIAIFHLARHVTFRHDMTRSIQLTNSLEVDTCRALLFDKLDTAEMHWLDTSNASSRVETWRDEPSGIWVYMMNAVNQWWRFYIAHSSLVIHPSICPHPHPHLITISSSLRSPAAVQSHERCTTTSSIMQIMATRRSAFVRLINLSDAATQLAWSLAGWSCAACLPACCDDIVSAILRCGLTTMTTSNNHHPHVLRSSLTSSSSLSPNSIFAFHHLLLFFRPR